MILQMGEEQLFLVNIMEKYYNMTFLLLPEVFNQNYKLEHTQQEQYSLIPLIVTMRL